MSEHPTRAELDAVLRGGLPPQRQKKVFMHLLQGCEDCRSVVAQARFSSWAPAPPPPAVQEEAYDGALERAFAAAVREQRRLRRKRSPAEESAVLDAGGPVGFAGGDAPYLPAVDQVQALLARSWAARHESPRDMVSLARYALVAARALDPQAHGERQVADLQARAWGELANALRTADDLDEAREAFQTAFEILPRGTGDELLEARLLDLRASFHGARRRFEQVFAELDTVRALYLRLGEFHLAGRVLIKKAVYVHYAGRSTEALDLNEEGMALIDEKQEPGLVSTAIHNQLWFLVACGRLAEAKQFLARERDRLRDVGLMVGLRLRWLEGQIGLGLGEWDDAEQALREVCQGFESAGLGFHAAVASLDLALLQMRQGRSDEAAKRVAESVGVFRALRIPREALGAVLLLEQAFEMQRATLTLLESAVEFLRRSEVDPQAHFVPRF